MNCPSCNKEIKDAATACPYCGEVVVKKERGNITFPLNPLAKPLSVWSYIFMIVIGIISPVNIILFLIWAFSPSTNINRKNFARAMLILWLVAIIAISAFYLLTIYVFNAEFILPAWF